MNHFRCNNMPFRRYLRQSPVGVAGIAHNSQRSRRVAAGAASLRSLAHWASASLHPALLSLGSAPLLKGAAAEAAEDCLIPAKAVEMRKSVSHR
mgnify:CR=1 FL=1